MVSAVGGKVVSIQVNKGSSDAENMGVGVVVCGELLVEWRVCCQPSY